jgi:radical SAM/Cys-rich protein
MALDKADPKAPLNPFDESLKAGGLYPLTSRGVSLLQINMGALCNQACLHCHVEAGPKRKESASKEVLEACLDAIRREDVRTVDITGGAPEMNPCYRWFVQRLKGIGCHVKTRTNLTILLEEGYSDLPGFFAENSIEVIASLPYYLMDVADRQRGKGVFEKSIEALKRLNAMGYGNEGSPLTLNMVYNPCGAFLPPTQASIEADFRKELKRRYNVSFSSLFTITNMPVGRFLRFLKDSGNLKPYMERLSSSYNPSAAQNAMCRDIISVSWDGGLYDCDFNQMLGLKLNHGAPAHIKEFDPEKIRARRIATGVHCFGCTAGAGSSCTGTIA